MNQPCALGLLVVLMAAASTSAICDPAATHQVGPGQTGSLTPGDGKVQAKPHHLLQNALTPKTRATLQQAMDATPDET